MQTKEFGIFVGLYNKTNNTKLSVKQASNDAVITSLYSSVLNLTKSVGNTYTVQKSTKARSYELTNKAKTDTMVLNCIKSNNGITRSDISAELGMRLQTVCGAVSRLLQGGYIQVSGETIDPETNRLVQVLTEREF